MARKVERRSSSRPGKQVPRRQVQAGLTHPAVRRPEVALQRRPQQRGFVRRDRDKIIHIEANASRAIAFSPDASWCVA
jgi:hypothetical protein